ncbi:hypothetical protein GC089_16640 [Cellulomonas sp. JZ18]|uniref:hypothetical protein n=1 Tax=Cellulomonas sp. JZ18 TaxID=2654191 RepID=UPI0012D4036C|nr:hypothetical protein [Cellulomonas sp. JZ18]QGQ20514.1 hypothetical protein GC089_16640 [Cellulomonas sp. JZ18]
MPRTARRSSTTLLAVTVVALTLTACSAGDGGTAAPPSPPLAQTAAAPSPAPSVVGTGPADLTPDGTTLPADQSAVVRYALGDRASGSWREAHYRTSVVAVEPADEEALAAVDVSGGPAYDPQAEDAFYLRARHELLWAESSDPLEVLDAPNLFGWTDQGERSTTFMVFDRLTGPFECADEPLVGPEVGATVQTCSVVTVPAGQTVVAVGTETGAQPFAVDAQGRPTFASVLWLLQG